MATTNSTPALTVYHDGACPLCQREIALYRRQRGAEEIAFVDVAACGTLAAAPDLKRDTALARFHVRDAQGQLVSGARAFALLWRTLPGWRWAGRIAGAPGVVQVLEVTYRCVLLVRPALQGLVRRLERAPR